MLGNKTFSMNKFKSSKFHMQVKWLVSSFFWVYRFSSLCGVYFPQKIVSSVSHVGVFSRGEGRFYLLHEYSYSQQTMPSLYALLQQSLLKHSHIIQHFFFFCFRFLQAMETDLNSQDRKDLDKFIKFFALKVIYPFS